MKIGQGYERERERDFLGETKEKGGGKQDLVTWNYDFIVSSKAQ